ncbi:MAG TPA: hypothetical protein VLS89_12200 [Candidatus Nanopelagicales bacterium]|nr:hypothetical protein [Candidatus Nanopelagicales bacterium]
MRPRALAVILWGVGGVVLLLTEAIVRLASLAAGLLRARALTPAELLALAAWTVVIVYAEGYRGFQRRFSPRVVARALHLAAHPRPHLIALAPLLCMGLLHATRRLLIVSWSLLAGILALILLVRLLPPVYRAIIDIGVALALTWGTASILVFLARALTGKPLPVPPETPPTESTLPT